MQQTRSVEIGTGLFVLLGMSALFFLTTQTTGGERFSADETYEVEAYFENVGSLKPRAPVAMSGVTIGRVTSVTFDPDRLQARVTFEIDNKYGKIPDDSDASILTSGLLGSQYIGLQAGGSCTVGAGFNNEITVPQADIVLGIILQLVVTPARNPLFSTVADLDFPVRTERSAIKLVTPHHLVVGGVRRWRIHQIATLG